MKMHCVGNLEARKLVSNVQPWPHNMWISWHRSIYVNTNKNSGHIKQILWLVKLDSNG
jgi:hypothetical protein